MHLAEPAGLEGRLVYFQKNKMDFAPELPPCSYHPHYLHPLELLSLEKKKWNQACQPQPDPASNVRDRPRQIIILHSMGGNPAKVPGKRQMVKSSLCLSHWEGVN